MHQQKPYKCRKRRATVERGLAFSYALIVRFFGGFVNIGSAVPPRAGTRGKRCPYGTVAQQRFTVKAKKIFALTGEQKFFRRVALRGTASLDSK